MQLLLLSILLSNSYVPLYLDIWLIDMVAIKYIYMELYGLESLCSLCHTPRITGSILSSDASMLKVFIVIYLGAIAISVIPLLADYVSHKSRGTCAAILVFMSSIGALSSAFINFTILDKI